MSAEPDRSVSVLSGADCDKHWRVFGHMLLEGDVQAMVSLSMWLVKVEDVLIFSLEQTNAALQSRKQLIESKYRYAGHTFA